MLKSCTTREKMFSVLSRADRAANKKFCDCDGSSTIFSNQKRLKIFCAKLLKSETIIEYSNGTKENYLILIVAVDYDLKYKT